jgi:short subunit dehydrogenase-like uncharacterized protein
VGIDVDILVAESQDPTAIDSIVAQTRVLLNTAGPTEQAMDEGWFRCELLGWGSEGQSVRGLIADVGDPGNRATVKFVCESALCLAVDFDHLPGGAARGGILTPATGFGDVLVERLKKVGMRLEVEMCG